MMKTTTEEQHALMVNRLVKPGTVLYKEYNPSKADIMHATLGIVTEAGELADACKKYAIYNQIYDRENAIEELGDLEFYMCQLRQAIGISREACLKANMTKLLIRYPNYKYKDSAAKERADKK